MLCVKEAALAAQSNWMPLYCAISDIMNSVQRAICEDLGALSLLKGLKFKHILGTQHGPYMLFIAH